MRCVFFLFFLSVLGILLHRTTLSTQLFSSLRTSSLNDSTSCQQSSGRRSFSSRHRTTSPRAFSTLSGRGRSCFRLWRRARRASTSADTVRLSPRAASSSVVVLSEAFSSVVLSAAFSCADSLLNSSATRAWTASSKCSARDTSDCVGGERANVSWGGLDRECNFSRFGRSVADGRLPRV